MAPFVGSPEPRIFSSGIPKSQTLTALLVVVMLIQIAGRNANVCIVRYTTVVYINTWITLIGSAYDSACSAT